jgi:hypothetical protein
MLPELVADALALSRTLVASKKASAGDFQQYLDELKSRKNFVADVVMVDYMGECSPSRRLGSNATQYDSLGEIVSELKALAVENNVALLTAAQTNRDGYESDPSLKNTGLSYEINSVADLIIGLVKIKDVRDRLACRVLKNRNREHKPEPFEIGVDWSKMKLHDVTHLLNEKRKAIPYNKKLNVTGTENKANVASFDGEDPF